MEAYYYIHIPLLKQSPILLFCAGNKIQKNETHPFPEDTPRLLRSLMKISYLRM